MEEKGEKFLPIGTVVKLSGGKKRLMITGFGAISESNKEKIWDYSGCMYPEGFLSSKQIFIFDHEQIEEICYMGLSEDDEEKKFKELLIEIENQIKLNKKSND